MNQNVIYNLQLLLLLGRRKAMISLNFALLYLSSVLLVNSRLFLINLPFLVNEVKRIVKGHKKSSPPYLEAGSEAVHADFASPSALAVSVFVAVSYLVLLFLRRRSVDAVSDFRP